MQAISTQTNLKSRNRLWRLAFQICVGLLILGSISPLYPPFLQKEVKLLLRAFAYRNHYALKIGDVSGSLWHPIRVRNVMLSAKNKQAALSELQIADAIIMLSWKNVVLKRGVGWFQKLALDGVGMRMSLPSKSSAEAESGGGSKKERRALKIPIPVELAAQKVNVTVRQGEEYLSIEEMQFAFQAYASGPLLIKRIEFHHPNWEKEFTQVYGGISLQDDKICATDVLLEPGLTINSLAVSLPEIEKGKLKADFSSRAFAGNIRGEILSVGHDGGSLSFDASGSFSQIAIGQLVAFLASEEKATGVIKEGKFSFHGSPRNLPKATISTRFEASDFQWRQRKWSSLIIGASLFNRRLQVPEFQLKQAHNSLSLSGEMTLPSSSQAWWQADLACNLKAKLDNITELSELLGPDIGEAAGHATVEGNVRGQKGAFNGQFIIAGSKLSYRSAPLDVLNAAVTLREKEIEISHAEFAHKDDYFRAHGVVTLTGERRYTGEIKASVADLALYASILQPPIAPYPFRGSLLLDWSGDGSANSHSGAFRARLKEVRPLLPDAFTPDYSIHADMEATYAPEHLYLGKLVIGEPDNNFSAKVTADPASIKLEGLKVQQKGAARMEGDALLPLNIWKAWQNPAAKEIWDTKLPCTVNLKFKQLDLHESAAIFGREFPVRGDLHGEVVTSGSINQLDIQGKLALSQGAFPLSIGGPELRGIQAAATLSGHKVRLDNFSAILNGDEFTMEGTLDAGNLQDPGLDLLFHSKAFTLNPRPDLSAKVALDLQINGSLTGAAVTGQARVTSLALDHPLELEKLFFGKQKLNTALAFDILPEMTKNWEIDVHLSGTAATKLLGTAGRVEPEARLIGSPKAARVSGLLQFAGFTASSPRATFEIQQGALSLGGPGGNPDDPSLVMTGKGVIDGKPFQAHILGSLQDKKVSFNSALPLEEAEFRKAISANAGSSPELPKTGFGLDDLPPKPVSAPLEPLESLSLDTDTPSLPLPNLPPPNL